jgi:hypothetical protein
MLDMDVAAVPTSCFISTQLYLSMSEGDAGQEGCLSVRSTFPLVSKRREAGHVDRGGDGQLRGISLSLFQYHYVQNMHENFPIFFQ